MTKHNSRVGLIFTMMIVGILLVGLFFYMEYFASITTTASCPTIPSSIYSGAIGSFNGNTGGGTEGLDFSCSPIISNITIIGYVYSVSYEGCFSNSGTYVCSVTDYNSEQLYVATKYTNSSTIKQMNEMNEQVANSSIQQANYWTNYGANTNQEEYDALYSDRATGYSLLAAAEQAAIVYNNQFLITTTTSTASTTSVSTSTVSTTTPTTTTVPKNITTTTTINTTNQSITVPQTSNNGSVSNWFVNFINAIIKFFENL